MKVSGSNIVEMSIEGKETASSLVIPDLDLVIVTTADEQRLRWVEVYPSYWSFMFF